VAAPDVERWQRLFVDSMKSSTERNFELQLKRADDSPVYTRVDCSPVAASNAASTLRVTLTDMSGHHEAELARQAAERKNALLIDELERHRQHLEDMVAERTGQLVTARDVAETANRAKNLFLATVSHELRTPLNAIIGFSELLLAGTAGELNTEQAKQLSIIQRAGRQQLDLVVDILDIANIETGHLSLTLEPVALRQALVEQCEQIRTTADARGIVLDLVDCDEEILVRADRRRLEQAVRILLSNAIKFTDIGHVQVRAAVEGTAARVVIEDTGIGISLDHQAGLFRPFARVTELHGQLRPGTGLGLAICSKLVEAMVGTIGVESAPGRGSRFWFTVPLA
jgi:signal transduction histidine kinase